MRFKALYTKQLTKKQKTWIDGFVNITAADSLNLQDETGTLLSSTWRPKSLQLHAEYEEVLTCFEGYLVQIDGEAEGASETAVQQLQLQPAEEHTARATNRARAWGGHTASSQPLRNSRQLQAMSKQTATKTWPSMKTEVPVDMDGNQLHAQQQVGLEKQHQQQTPTNQWGQSSTWKTLRPNDDQPNNANDIGRRYNMPAMQPSFPTKVKEAQHIDADAQQLLAWLGINPSAATSRTPAQPHTNTGHITRPAMPYRQNAPMSVPSVWGQNMCQQPSHVEKPHTQHNTGHQQHHQQNQLLQCPQDYNKQQDCQGQVHRISPQAVLPQHPTDDRTHAQHHCQHIGIENQEMATDQKIDDVTDMPLAKRVRATQHVSNAAGTANNAGVSNKLQMTHGTCSATGQSSSWSGMRAEYAAGVLNDVSNAPLVASGKVNVDTPKPRNGFMTPQLSKQASEMQPSKTKLVTNHLTSTNTACMSPFVGITIPPITATPTATSKTCVAQGTRQASLYQQSLERKVVIPTRHYHNSLEYLRTLQQALTEEINLRVAEAAQTLQGIILDAMCVGVTADSKGSILHGAACDVSTVNHATAAGGLNRPAGNMQQSAQLGTGIERACERLRHPYFAGAQLSVYKPSKFHNESSKHARGKQNSHKAGGKRKANRGAGSDDSSADEKSAAAAKPGMRAFLTIPQARSRIKEFRRQDLWFLSTHPLLNPSNNGQAGYQRVSLLVVRSLWHGPDKNGKIEVEVLTPVTANLPMNQEVYAWRGPYVQTELQTMQLLHAACLNPAAYGIPTARTSNRPAIALNQQQGSWGSLDKQATTQHTFAAGTHKHVTSALTHLLNLDVPYQTMYDVRNVGSVVTKPPPARKALKVIKTKTVPLPTQLPIQATSPATAVFCEGADEMEDFDTDMVSKSEPQARVKAAKIVTDRDEDSDIPWPELANAKSPTELLAALNTQFTLNKDQQRVAQHVASWLTGSKEVVGGNQQTSSHAAGNLHDNRPKSPVCLIHGPFGSGKSTLLAALITLLVAARNLPGSPPCRILVAAHTNVAVDRVLLALQDRGFTSFLRVGSLPKIARSILCRSLHAADDSRDARSQLRSMLASETNDTERRLLEQELADLEAGHERQRRKLLSTSPVVGTTCAALLQSDVWELAGHFSVVVLDECSQMTEPTSLIPLLKAQPSFLIAAGDPLQLPPVIANPTNLTIPPASKHTASSRGLDGPAPNVTNQPALQSDMEAICQTEQHGLKRPLFVRLQHLGHPVHLLGTQYRCHPTIAYVPNHLFYSGRLSNGCTAKQRQAISAAPSLPALSLCELPDGSQALVDPRTHSCYNITEAQHVVQVLTALITAGVDGSQLGVICFYKAQVAKIRQLLQGPGSNSAMSVQVATVDSFQGAEKDVIILATTMTRATQAEFVGDACRLVVALTRARRHLIAFGVSRILSSASPALARVVGLCKSTSGVAQADLQLGSMGYFALGSLLQRIECNKVAQVVSAPDCQPQPSSNGSPIANSTGTTSSLNPSISSQGVCSQEHDSMQEDACDDMRDVDEDQEFELVQERDGLQGHRSMHGVPPWYTRSTKQQGCEFIQPSMMHTRPQAALHQQPQQPTHMQPAMPSSAFPIPPPVHQGHMTTTQTNHRPNTSVPQGFAEPAHAYAACNDCDCDDDELWDALDMQEIQREHAPGFSFSTRH